ncbi:MAG: AAA family ATPase [Acidimicrobiales bacterium]|nr:AAA family ATPase [Acidimicrobiales bacterium]MCB9392849.1 AAA family ATPase [Acidimicrobiaceae bacterium]
MLTVHLLGPIDVRLDGASLDLGGPQQRAVVAHLALDAGHVVSVERLIDRLWGDEPPRTPLGTLQSYVSRLRRAIEPRRATGAPPEVLVSEAPGYVLRVSPEQVDVHRFRQLLAAARRAAADADHARAVDVLDEALGLWRGPALAGIGNDDLVRPVVVRLEDERNAALAERFDALLALGRHQEVIPQLQAAVEAQPLHERLWALLALAYYRSSRQADALRAVSRAREVLADELGLDLGPELRDLEQRILVHDPTLVLAASPSPSAAAPRQPDVVVPAAPSLVGRPHEWAALTSALDAAVTVPALVVVEGEPGIGKSTLADAFLASARQLGWHTVTGRCLEPGLAPTLWPFIEIARDLLAETAHETAHDAAHDIAHETAHEAAHDIDRSGGPQATWRRLASGQEVALKPVEVAAHFVELLDHVAHRPGRAGCVVHVDDLHWADGATLDLLRVVLTQLDRGGVLVVTATRPPESEPGSLVGAAMAGLHRAARAVTRVRMEPLDPSAVGELIALTTGVVPSDDVAARVHARAGGNPLFVTELARLAGERGIDAGREVPAAIRDVVRSRLAALPDHAMAELEVAAVLGERCSARTVMAASERDPDACLDALDAAIVTRILVPEPQGFRFAHALVRDAVLAGLPALRLARLHQRAADAMSAVHGDAADVAEPIAHHRLAASSFADPVTVARAAVRASDVARWRNALDTAEWFVERALSVLDGVPRTAELALAELEALEALIGAAVRRQDPVVFAQVTDRVRRHGETTGSDAATALAGFLEWDIDESTDLVDGEVSRLYHGAAALLARTADPQAQVIAAYMVASYEMLVGRLDDAERHVRIALAALGPHDADVAPVHVPIVLLPLVGAITMALRDRPDEARELAHRRLRAWLAQRAEVDEAAKGAFAFTSGLIEVVLAEPERALGFLGRRGHTDEFGFLEGQGVASDVLIGWCRVKTGDPSGASLVFAGLEQYLRTEERSLRPTLQTLAAEVCLDLGDERVFAMLDAAEHDARPRHELWWMPETMRIRALALSVTGDVEAALDVARAARALAAEQGSSLLLRRIDATIAALGGQPSR